MIILQHPELAAVTTGAAATLEYNLDFFTGLTIVTSGGSAGNLTIVYD